MPCSFHYELANNLIAPARGHCECSTGARSFATTTDLLLFFPMWQEHHLTMRIPSFARRQLRFWHVCMPLC